METPLPPEIRLGAILLREGLITPEQLEIALGEQLRVERRLGEILVAHGWVDSRAIARALAEQYELPYLELEEFEIDHRTAALLPETLARRYRAVPIGWEHDGPLVVAISDPTDVVARNELEAALDADLRLVVVDDLELEQRLDATYSATLAR